MKKILISVERSDGFVPDDYQMEDIEDDIRSALGRHLNSHDWTLQVFDE